jgi:hypothetical protein
MFYCEKCQRFGTRTEFKIINDFKFKNPNNIFMCDKCLIEIYNEQIKKKVSR